LHIPVLFKSARDDGTFWRADSYNQEADVYICPAGKVLTSTGTLVNDGATPLYRASKHDCDARELKFDVSFDGFKMTRHRQPAKGPEYVRRRACRSKSARRPDLKLAPTAQNLIDVLPN
jgi:hypothetical protein